MSIVSDLKPGLNAILGIRDDLGAALKEVYLVTRSWSGGELGEGDPTEIKVRMLPSPRVVEFKHDLRIKEGGAVQQGDILLKMISKVSFPKQCDVDGSTNSQNVEKFYEVGGILYRVVGVTEKHLTWNVLLRPISNQARDT